MQIDINCDMGESFGPWPMGNDEVLLQYVTSANIACGFHAGDPLVMQKTVRLALKYHVAIGAHPGYPDLQGFGRRNLQMTPQEVYAMTLYQIGALAAIVRAEGGRLHHVKAHGALYNAAAKDRSLADAIAKAVQHFDAALILYGLSGSAQIEAGKALNLRTCSEVFPDRSYQDDGSLTPRAQDNALIDNSVQVANQALQMVGEQSVTAASGKKIGVLTETLCIHGDGVHALEFARAVFFALKEQNIELNAP